MANLGGDQFAHDSERRVAELLSFYGVRWQYEPHEFVLARNDDGAATSAIRPDFYLVDYDCYIEITTLRQRLVTRKNRKVARLRALYPSVEIRVLYRRDLEALFGRFVDSDRAPGAPVARVPS